MTKRDILLQVGRMLGDTSDDFITNILAPSFDFVLADLASMECVEAVQRKAEFIIAADTWQFETRELCGLGPHYPSEIVALLVPSWGTLGRIHHAESDREFENYRLAHSPITLSLAASQWFIWRCYPNARTLEVWPPAGTSQAGVEAEIIFIAPWTAIGLDDDVLDIQQEDIECVALGLECKGVKFSETLRQDRDVLYAQYERAKKRMWGRRHVHAGVIGGHHHGTHAR